MKVFIENPQGSINRTRYDETTLKLKNTFDGKYPYPYNYGFIMDAKEKNGDCIDCYVLSKNKLKQGSIVECIPFGMLEMLEDDEQDNKVIMTTEDKSIDSISIIANTIMQFIKKVFTRFPDAKIEFGKVYDQAETLEYIHKRR